MNRKAYSIWALLCLWAASAFGQGLELDFFEQIKARSIGPAGMSGRVTSIDAVTDNPDIIYAGTASGGLWKSTSGGIDWEPIFDDQKVASIGAVAIYQANPDIVWVGTGEGNPRNSQTNGYGVYRSLDGGATWACMGLEETRNIHRVLIHPENPDVVYVGAQGVAWGESEHRGVYKTTDGGETWEKILYANENTGIGDLVMDPTNPNKLIAAMWQFRRWPYFFKSGGEGSGLHVTLDGGKNWTQRTDKDGLPAGELGRIGLAISPSNPERVYALVESKKNAFYRSDDGGRTFRKTSTDDNIGNRPFYYADIFVDPKNENRIYSIHSLVTKSEDGGKTFEVLLPYSRVHPDHHAWYIHPEDPHLLMNGNDGGMSISRNMGKNWEFVENLPLAQFYHINYDMEYPYHVYGGMQDNGSWQGPAYVWNSGGIRNAYWKELFFGDGFDVVPDPDDARYGYAMSQGGNVGRYDVETGQTQFIKPVHPEGEKLRFNWNAAIAQDPFDANTIYYGSQFVHRSRNKGSDWEVISPDLTTNDPEKQKQLESGGLTFDVTNAENYTSLIAIEPSAVERGLIWTGSDDGKLYLTRNAGENWTDLSDRLPDAPENGWIPQVVASLHNAGEAFVVLNNYRQHDYTPYLFHTTDYGQSWTNLVDEDAVWGHCLSVVQDPEAENLLFLGTEFGLYVSVDKGKSWTQFTHEYPTASTMDLKIHPREADLIIGTFGRAAFIVDDIRPLRAVAQEGNKLLDQNLVAFASPEAVLAAYGQAPGTRFAADGIFKGENRRGGAVLNCWLMPPPQEEETEAEETGDSEEATEEMEEEEAPSYDSVKVEILNGTTVIRTFYAKADSGLNRIRWSMSQKGVRMPFTPKSDDPRYEASGRQVLPGTYGVRFTYGEFVEETEINVIHDPRIEMKREHMVAQAAQYDAMAQYLSLTTEAMDHIRNANKTLKQVEGMMAQNKGHEAMKELQKATSAMRDSLKMLKFQFVSDDSKQGIFRNPDVVTANLWQMSAYLDVASRPTNGTQQLVMEQFKGKVLEAVEAVNAFFEKDWPPYRQQVEAAKLELFPAFDPIGLER